METGPALSANAGAGPSSETSTPAAFDDDGRHGPSAVAASQLPKLAMSASASPIQENNTKDVKSLGTRFHEDCQESELFHGPRLRSSRMFKGKGKESIMIERPKREPLQLLDLPVDIITSIIREVTHTNDLTALALCCSALHSLAIPHIYSRFDIVWPDSSTHAEPRSGVDALTYGLATLVMAEEIFGEAPNQRQHHGALPYTNRRATDMEIRRRRGNHYAQYTKKFSLGNGPADWVQEYLITKEGGKMLGTLVALAIARMRSLETFIWDMPTGILRDVWNALASLGDTRGDEGHSSRLEKVWVRWHDNSILEPGHPSPSLPPPLNLNALASPPPLQSPNAMSSAQIPQLHLAALDRVEHPSFSELPPLKSFSVLDIDELSYLDEMAVLIGKSIDKLRELRIGIARHAVDRDWVTVWEGDNLKQVDSNYPTAGSLTIGEKRLGGVLGTLTGFVHDMRRPRLHLPDRTKRRRTTSSSSLKKDDAIDGSPVPKLQEVEDPPTSIPEAPSVVVIDETASTPPLSPSSDVHGDADEDPPENPGITPNGTTVAPSMVQEATIPNLIEKVDSDMLDIRHAPLANVLRLEILELERVPISVPVLQKAFDWTRITSLTLLHCLNHEQLWKTLRKVFAPMPRSPTYPQPRRTSTSTPKKNGKTVLADGEFDYPLKLKKLHTNTVSAALISFLKETLAPNSLEVLFLQEARSYSSTVTIDAIYRGPVRRHRDSLKKVLIDSSEKGPDGLPASSSRWRRWMVTREILLFMCSGKMPSLRELGMAIDYRDWHFFLQRLPSIPHLRSLTISFLADHVHGTNVDPRELALQIVDIVALRPEVELCYMGIANKCFEILENRKDGDGRGDTHLISSVVGVGAVDATSEDGEDEDGVEAEVDDPDEADPEEEETESDLSEDEDEDGDESSLSANGAAPRLRLREILFYDDKVAIFKARHGRL